MQLQREFQRLFKPSIWLLALNAIFILLLFLKYIDYRYEYAVYRTLYNSNKVAGNPKQTFINLVNLTHKIQKERLDYIQNLQGMQPFKSVWFRSGDLQLLDANGSCGNFSHVLAELCQTGDFPVRIVQLERNGNFGAHIVVEAWLDSTNRWSVADGLYKKVFYNQDSTLASMREMQSEIPFIHTQLPQDYPYHDAYHHYRYTNWNKIPILMPAIHWLLVHTAGEKWTDKLCIRIYFLNLHKAYFIILLICYIPVFLKTIQHLIWYVKGHFGRSIL